MSRLTRPCRTRELRLPAAEEALQPLYAGDGGEDLRHPQGAVPQGGRDDLVDGHARPLHDHHVRPRLDPAFLRDADDPHRRHGAAPPRQYRRLRRRHECPARPLQHPGPHRPGAALRPSARLPDPARGKGNGLRRVHPEAGAQAAAPEPAFLLAELREVLREPDEGVVRRCGEEGEQLVLRLAAQARQTARRAPGLRGHVPGPDERLSLPGIQCPGRLSQQGQTRDSPCQAEISGRHGSPGHRDLRVLAELRRIQRRRPRQDPDQRLSPALRLLRRGGRLAGQFGPLAAMALEGGRAAGGGQGLDGDHGPDLRPPEGALQNRGRRFSRSDPQPFLALPNPRRSFLRGAGQGVFRQGAGRSRRPEGYDQDHQEGGRTAGRLRPAQGRRHHLLRLLDLQRFLDQGGNQMARRDNSDPFGNGQTLNWAWSWPANRRILYNRASCDPAGKPWNPKRQSDLVERQARGSARTCPTSRWIPILPTGWDRSS